MYLPTTAQLNYLVAVYYSRLLCLFIITYLIKYRNFTFILCFERSEGFMLNRLAMIYLCVSNFSIIGKN